jgi:hypothetical protein
VRVHAPKVAQDVVEGKEPPFTVDTAEVEVASILVALQASNIQSKTAQENNISNKSKQ